MVRQIILTLLLLSAQICFANMASPVTKGTSSGSVFSSRDIDILSETIHIKASPDFKTAWFKVDYRIQCKADGQQIPLLFLAQQYCGDFKVRVDGHEVNVQDVPAKFDFSEGSPFFKFSRAFPDRISQGEAATTTIHWDEQVGSLYQLRDLKYFETSLRKGIHQIQVEYIASTWVDRSAWVKEYSLPYALMPAKYWNSFGTLTIELDASNLKVLQSNLGKPQRGKLDAIAYWTFDELPLDYLRISYTPKIGALAKTLIQLGPDCLGLFLGLLLMILHFFWLIHYNSANPGTRMNRQLLLGSIFVPFLGILCYLYSFELIDQLIGPEASRFHGYTFLVWVIYPVLGLSYWLIGKAFLLIFATKGEIKE